MGSHAVGSLTHRVLELSTPSQRVPQFAAAKLGAVQFLPHTYYFSLWRGLEVLVGVGQFQCDMLFILPKTRNWLPRRGGCRVQSQSPCSHWHSPTVLCHPWGSGEEELEGQHKACVLYQHPPVRYETDLCRVLQLV